MKPGYRIQDTGYRIQDTGCKFKGCVLYLQLFSCENQCNHVVIKRS